MTQEKIDSIRERMCDNFCWFSGNRVPLEELECACEVCPLNELEASAERKERWLFNRQYHEADECVCSGCGQLMTTIHGERMNYCPNCGAKMEETNE